MIKTYDGRRQPTDRSAEMIDTGLFISNETLRGMPSNLKDRLLEYVFQFDSSDSVIAKAELAEVATLRREESSEDEHFAELSPQQARRFIRGCGDKTIKALRCMAGGKDNNVQVADIAKAVGVRPKELSGVWGGLTRRTQTVTSDDEGYLIWWSGIQKKDSKGEYMDESGCLSEQTYRSLRKAFGID